MRRFCMHPLLFLKEGLAIFFRGFPHFRGPYPSIPCGNASGGAPIPAVLFFATSGS